MSDVDKIVERGEQQSGSSDGMPDDEIHNGNSRPRHQVASFSVAHALSMVRQRRDAQERARQEEEKQLEEQRLLKAKEKRQRRRKNQKERKAKLSESAANLASSADNTAPAHDGMADKQDGLVGEADDHARGQKRTHDHEADDGGDLVALTNQKDDDDINLKRLPVKKRLRLKGSSEASNVAPPQAANLDSGESETAPVKKTTMLLPRALLLKKSKR